MPVTKKSVLTAAIAWILLLGIAAVVVKIWIMPIIDRNKEKNQAVQAKQKEDRLIDRTSSQLGLPELLRGVSAGLVQLGLVRKQMSYTEHGSVGFRRLRLVLHGNASLSSQSQDLQITEAKRKLKRWNIVLHIQFGLFMFSNANVIIGGVIGRAVWQGLSMLFMVLSIISAGIANHKVTKWETILKNLQRLSSTLASDS